MKRLLTKLVLAASGLALLTGVTYAAFTSNQTTITGVTLGSATPTLQVYDGANWGPTAPGGPLGITESNMIPGFIGAEHTFYLRNTSDASVSFGHVMANLVSGASGDWDALKDVVQMRFAETGVAWGPWYTLDAWNSGSADILASPLLGGSTQRQFSVQFQMLSSADDNAKGKTLTFTLGFVGQTP